jgi:predicted metal-binding protein
MADRAALEALFKEHGFSEFTWIRPDRIVLSQWVRMKCRFGCPDYGKNASCPPNTPSLAECERFFREYEEAAIFHFSMKVTDSEDRKNWSKKINTKLAKLEREIFLRGHWKAFMLVMATCCLCDECAGHREKCEHPDLARPTPEAMAVDVFETVSQFGLPINVLSGRDQEMNRYAFLMLK